MATKQTEFGSGPGFTAEEKAAMKQRAAELREQAKAAKAADAREQGVAAALAAIEALPEPDRSLGARIHEIVTSVAPQLDPSTWYGFPAYKKAGKVVVFYQSAAKFGTRYGTLGFQEDAQLDDGAMWPVAFAVLEIGDAEAARIAELVRRAAG